MKRYNTTQTNPKRNVIKLYDMSGNKQHVTTRHKTIVKYNTTRYDTIKCYDMMQHETIQCKTTRHNTTELQHETNETIRHDTTQNEKRQNYTN